jgi:hypothetical protein
MPVNVTSYVFCGVPTVFGFGREFLAASYCLSSIYVAEATSEQCGQKRSMCGHSPSTAGHSAGSPPLQLRGPLDCQTALADSVFRAPTPDRDGISWILFQYNHLYSIRNPPLGVPPRELGFSSARCALVDAASRRVIFHARRPRWSTRRTDGHRLPGRNGPEATGTRALSTPRTKPLPCLSCLKAP